MEIDQGTSADTSGPMEIVDNEEGSHSNESQACDDGNSSLPSASNTPSHSYSLFTLTSACGGRDTAAGS